MTQSFRTTDRPGPSGVAAGDADATTVDVGELLALLGDEYVRDLLGQLSVGSWTATELVAATTASKATVYRRLNRLVDAGFVATRMAFDPDGHHRQVYHLTVSEATLSLDDDGLSAAVRRDDPGARGAVPADD
jgi:DNA-binding HxlR family transcriptional regulator